VKHKFPFLALHRPWESNFNNIWITSTLQLSRNLNRFRFPGHLDRTILQQVRSLLQARLCQNSELEKPYFVPAEELGPLEKEFLYEHFLAPNSFQHTLAGEGFVLDNSGSFLATLNIDDHLHLQLTDCTEELELALNRLVKLDTFVGSSLEFACSPRFGFLTSNSRNCGTGLIVRLYLHLPALIHTHMLDQTLKHLENEEIEVLSIQGKIEESVGDLLVVRNRCTLGLTEQDILQTLRTYALKLMVAEKRIRTELRNSRSVEMKDKISRAYGLAIHSYQLETIEAWSALSLLKLAIDLGWLTGISLAQMNELLFTTRRAHLMCEYSQPISPDDLSHRRAEFVHSSLSQALLQI
jgi:protein arginine kinase